MSDQEEQEQRARRMREQIERLKANRPIKRPDRAKSLREQIDEKTAEIRARGDAEKPPGSR